MTKLAPFALLVGVVMVSIVSCAGTSQEGDRESALRADLAVLPLPEENISLVVDMAPEETLAVHAVTLTSRHLIVEDVKGRLFAMDRKSLMPAWHYYGLPRPVDFPIYEAAGSYLMIAANRLFQVEKVTGAEMGVHPMTFTPSSAPCGTDATAYVGSWSSPAGNKTLYSVNLADGQQGWGYRTLGHITAQPLVTGAPRQLVCFASHDRQVVAVEALGAFEAAPQPSWINETGGANTADLVVSENLLLVPSQEGSLYALDRATGAKVWEYISGEPLKSAATGTKRAVYFHNAYGFHRLDRAGHLVWKIETGATEFVLERAGKVWLRDAQGSLVIVDDTTGEIDSGHPLAGWYIPANPVDGTLFAVSPDGWIFAYTERLKLR